MDNHVHRGAITIYLSIVLSAVIMLSGVLMDIVRIRAAEVQVRRAVHTAAVSILAGYDTKIKTDYGLFALHNSGSGYLEEELQYYIQNQLENKNANENKTGGMFQLSGLIFENNSFHKVKFADLYDYKIEKIDVMPLYNLTENEIARQQIVEYMKYRAPAQFAENFLEKVNYAASAKETISAYKQKTNVEKKLGKIEKALKRLQDHIDIINKFEKNNFDCSPGSNSNLVSFCSNTILKEIYSQCSRASLGNLQDPDDRKYAMKAKERIGDYYHSAEQQASNSKGILEAQIVNSISAVEAARQELLNIQVLAKQIRADVESLKSYLNGLSKQSSTDKIDNTKLMGTMQSDIEKYEKLISEENSQSISEQLDSNYEILNHLRASLAKIQPIIISESKQISLDARRDFEESWSINVVDYYRFNELVGRLTSNAEFRSMTEMANHYARFSDVLQKGKSSKGIDPRKGTAEAAKRIRTQMQGTSSNARTIENPKQLPSYYINGSYPNKIFSEDMIDAAKPKAELPSVVQEFNADFDEDSSFVDEGFDYIIHFAEKLELAVVELRNETYVDEYILKVFKDVVEIPDAATDGKSTATFFEKAEVEYIIGGNANEEINKHIIKGQILLIRFAMNTLHVYTDPQKRTQALELATAVAGFTGFGIPIAHNLIMCAWGTAEAFYDIEEIYKGKRIAFVKSNENWHTELSPSGFKSRESFESGQGIMDFDYHDYLRLLLLVTDKNVKVNRIQDLIQLNIQQSRSGYEISKSNTYLKVNAEVSIRYWFITKLFVPERLRSLDGNRHLIKVEVWKGY